MREKQVDALDANRRSIERANAQQQQLLNQVKGEIGTLIAQEQARQAAAERAANAARLAQIQAAAQSAACGVELSWRRHSRIRSGQACRFRTSPAPSSGAAAAVAYAKAQLGKPYQYAATGPGCIRLLRDSR